MKRRFLARFLLPLSILIAAGAFLLFQSSSNHQTVNTDFKDEPSENKIIFDALQKKNPDIYAWLEIPDTEINVPICFRENDNAYYLEHDSSGQPDKGGAVFTEDYNSTDFNDPVTILYGHNGNMHGKFTSLQSGYTDPSFFREHKLIKIYTPKKKRWSIRSSRRSLTEINISYITTIFITKRYLPVFSAMYHPSAV